MPRSNPSDSPAAFWRCDRCGTPNPWAAYLTQCVGCGSSRPQTAAEMRASPAARSRPKIDLKALLRSRPRRDLRPSNPRRGLLVAVATWAYAAVVLAALVMIRWLGERWWPASVLLFAPRAMFLLPLPLLVLLAAWRGRKRLWSAQLAIAVVVLGPLMGFTVPVRRLWAPTPHGVRLRVMTFNRGQGKLDVDRLARLVEDERIDVIFFQEGNPDTELDAYLARGWRRDSRGRIVSRLPIVAELDPSELPVGGTNLWPVRIARVKVRMESGQEVVLASVHMPTMRYGFDMFREQGEEALGRYIDWRWEQLDRLSTKMGEAGDRPFLIGGDFNMPSDSPMMAALARSCRLGFEDVGWGFGYTRPTRLPWIRIDHVVASTDWTFTRCWVGPDLGSDHLPLLAELVLPDPR
jgi:endonuclease/exonuclease/phosphatase (EEP) superfamily protein YafD